MRFTNPRPFPLPLYSKQHGVKMLPCQLSPWVFGCPKVFSQNYCTGCTCIRSVYVYTVYGCVYIYKMYTKFNIHATKPENEGAIIRAHSMI